jgi:hypothetical protein
MAYGRRRVAHEPEGALNMHVDRLRPAKVIASLGPSGMVIVVSGLNLLCLYGSNSSSSVHWRSLDAGVMLEFGPLKSWTLSYICGQLSMNRSVFCHGKMPVM